MRNGDRVVFFGDSITQAGIYTNLVEAYYTSRFPEESFSFRNAGWGGNTAEDGLNRLERDVLSLNPSLVIINFGMNDGRYQALTPERLAWYLDNQEEIILTLKSAGVRMLVLTPNAVDVDYPAHRIRLPEYPPALERMSKDLMAMTSSYGIRSVDMFHPMAGALVRCKRMNKQNTFLPEGVHPDDVGHLVMAYIVLSTLEASGRVADITIDADSGMVQADGSDVYDISTGNSISFTARDSGLPMFIPKEAEAGLALVPVQRRLNRHVLKVFNLSDGDYEVRIDGESLGIFGRDDLAAGINLSNYPTPMWRQAERLWKLIVTKNDLYFHRWRDVQLYEAPDWLQHETLEKIKLEVLADLDAKIAQLEKEISQQKQPVAHRFELRRE